MPEVILPCPNPKCGSTNIYVRGRCNAQVTCRPCGMEGPEFCGPNEVIAAWNALPRMSAVIAWQFQAAGIALALQRIMDSGLKMREEQHVQWLLGNNEDSVTEAEAVFDGLIGDGCKWNAPRA